MTGDATLPLFTIGHSTRTIEGFVDLLRCGSVDMLVDIRSTPRSRTNPQYNLDSLPASLAEYQIGHIRIDELGGRRPKSKTVPPETNAFWNNQSFHNYADYALSDEFRSGLDQLRELASVRRCAVMCSEAVWWRCHRRFVADYMLSEGREVFHLMGDDRVEPATINPAARKAPEGLVYPAE
jgi:uncharacterized protein (DUF488 family)